MIAIIITKVIMIMIIITIIVMIMVIIKKILNNKSPFSKNNNGKVELQIKLF